MTILCRFLSYTCYVRPILAVSWHRLLPHIRAAGSVAPCFDLPVTKDCKQSQSSFELREMHVSRAFLYISFRVPSKGAPPPGSPNRAPIERDAPFPEASFNYISLFLGKWIPPPSPQVPQGERCPSPDPYSTCKSLLNKPPSRFPSGAPIERDARLQSLSLHTLLDHQ